MRIIISPAKKMEECTEIFESGALPEYLEKTKVLYKRLSAMTEAELKAVFCANDQITHQNFLRYRSMDVTRTLIPALLSYIGIQYQYMAPQLFSYQEWDYVREHLRILSGFYGILRPDDKITPYRLEMQAKLDVEDAERKTENLYDFWGNSLYRSLIGKEEKPVILNLASKEYSKAIEPYLTPDVRYVTCIFGVLESKEGKTKVKVKATEAKMARGEMVRYMAQNRIEEIEEIKEFSRLGYRYRDDLSDRNNFVYIKQKSAV